MVHELSERARAISVELAKVSTETKNITLLSMTSALERVLALRSRRSTILTTNPQCDRYTIKDS